MEILGRRALLLTLGVGLLGSVEGVEAQDASGRNAVVAGSVEDRVQGRPLPQAVIRFFAQASGDTVPTELAAETATDAEGRFATNALSVGTYRLEVSADGYQTVEDRVQVDAGSLLDLQIEMVPELVALEGIVVVARRSRMLEANGFYDRRAQGLGRTFTREEIQDLGYSRTSEVLGTISGVTVRQAGSQANPYVFLRGGCRPDLIVDGMNLGGDVPVDNIISADNLEGLEVHGTATLPIQFANNPCGAVVMWTIDPSSQESTGPFSWARLLVPAGVILGLFLVW